MNYSYTVSYLGGRFVQWYDYVNIERNVEHKKYPNGYNEYYDSFFKIELDYIKNNYNESDVVFIDEEYFSGKLNDELVSRINSKLNCKLVIIYKDCGAPLSQGNVEVISPEYYSIDECKNTFNYYLLNAGKQPLRELSKSFWNYNKNQIRYKKFLFTNGTVKPHRTVMYNFLKESNIIENTLCSYLGYHINKEKNTDIFDESVMYLSDFDKPIYLDTTWDLGEPQSEFTPLGLISNCYFDLVSCTQFENTHNIFTSEKVFRPFLSFVFPIFVGQYGLCNLLRNLGFDLFDDIIDHSYDLEKNPSTRIKKLFDEINRLNKFSNLELHEIYTKKEKIFLYNFKLLETLADAQVNILNKYKITSII